MGDNTSCATTHRQIVRGPCPYCDSHIEHGQAAAASEGESPVRWDWAAMEASLRKGDLDARSTTVWNLTKAADALENVVPLLDIALADADPDARSLAEHACSHIGRDLSAKQALWLEEQVGDSGRGLTLRAILLGKYFGSKNRLTRTKRAFHIYWIIEHHPDCGVARTPEASLSRFDQAARYERAKELWLEQCAARKTSAAVMGNAAQFFLLNESDLAERFYKAAQVLEPHNPRWHERLAHVYQLSSRHGSEETRSQGARRSLVELEMAEQIRSSHSRVKRWMESQATEPLRRLHALPKRARAAFEAGEVKFAREYAEECLALTTGSELDEYFRNNGDAIHQSHLVLGRVALREGDLERAKWHLIESGKTKGSPVLGSFGPNMSLAKDLLEAGERAVVLEYLEQCGKFWKRGASALAQWRDEITEGHIPWFGANLDY
jgi:tetratricopeptide (TPR) repeat protein